MTEFWSSMSGLLLIATSEYGGNSHALLLHTHTHTHTHTHKTTGGHIKQATQSEQARQQLKERLYQSRYFHLTIYKIDYYIEVIMLKYYTYHI